MLQFIFTYCNLYYFISILLILSFFNASTVYIRSACALLTLPDFWHKWNWISVCSKIFYHDNLSVSQFSLTDNINVITLRNFKLSSFKNWVHKNNTSMPSFSFQISSSFLHKSINSNSRLHFITAWMKVLHMK
jgi:hypothetical protein